MATPQAGKKEPPITLDDQHGDKVKLADLTGRRVLVYLYP